MIWPDHEQNAIACSFQEIIVSERRHRRAIAHNLIEACADRGHDLTPRDRIENLRWIGLRLSRGQDVQVWKLDRTNDRVSELRVARDHIRQARRFRDPE